MAREANRILGINPGTRYLGLAVFNDTELLDWRVKTFIGKWTKEKEDRILEIIREQIEIYRINTIAIKKLHSSRASKNLKLLVSRIRNVGRKKQIKIQSYSIKELEKYFLTDSKANKRNLAERIVVEYPMLVHELNKEKSRRNSYFMRAIEAVALGIKIRNDIDS